MTYSWVGAHDLKTTDLKSQNWRSVVLEDSKDHREVVLAHCCSRSEPMRLNE